MLSLPRVGVCRNRRRGSFRRWAGFATLFLFFALGDSMAQLSCTASVAKYLLVSSGIAADSSGNVYVGDFLNNRIRISIPAASGRTLSGSPTALQAPASGSNLTVSIQTTASYTWTVSGVPGCSAFALSMAEVVNRRKPS